VMMRGDRHDVLGGGLLVLIVQHKSLGLLVYCLDSILYDEKNIDVHLRN
jgi:hypothetical protein